MSGFLPGTLLRVLRDHRTSFPNLIDLCKNDTAIVINSSIEKVELCGSAPITMVQLAFLCNARVCWDVLPLKSFRFVYDVILRPE